MSKAKEQMEEKPWVRIVYENKIRATPALQPRKSESPSAHRVRCEETVAKEWGMAVSTLRACKGEKGRRRPTLKSHPKFFADLAKFGGAKFGEDGKLDRATLDIGPDPISFMLSTPAGSDRPRDRV